MPTIILFCVLIGAIVGMRLKLPGLIPVAIVAFLVAALMAMVRGDQAWTVVISALSSVVALQLGYFCCSFVRSVLADGGDHQRTSRSASVSARTSI